MAQPAIALRPRTHADGQVLALLVLLPAALAVHVVVGVLGRFRHGRSQRTVFTDHLRVCT